MAEVQRIGEYLEADSDGFLQKTASASKVAGIWSEMVDAANECCIERWGDDLHSVYVRGSVANGRAIEGVSDVDMVVVMRADGLDLNTASTWSSEAESELEARFPDAAGGFELALLTERSVLMHGSPDSVVLKLECTCVHGEDLGERIAPYRPGPEIALQIKHFGGGLDVFRDEYPEEPQDEKKSTMAWLMRRFLRAGMELVMVEEQRYTRDLYLCYESFAGHYPSERGEMYRALELAINPAPDTSNEAFILSFGEWLERVCDSKLAEWERAK